MRRNNAMRRRGNADHINHSIRVESAGNATIVNRAGETVAVLENWRLYVNGQDVGEVDNYHEAMKKCR